MHIVKHCAEAALLPQAGSGTAGAPDEPWPSSSLVLLVAAAKA